MANHFEIERFYFGNLIIEGQPVGSPGIIASSPGVGLPQVQECLKVARIAPPPFDQTSSKMPSAMGLFKGDTIEYIFLKSQRTAEGHPQLLYMILPGMALRWLGGNYSFLAQTGSEEMPAFDKQRRDLKPFVLENPQPLDDSQQVELLYDLYFYCGDDIKNVEGLLAALIHRQNVAIVNAPPDLTIRMRFIHGLLSLLPAPARVGVTWTTSTERAEETRTQIKFLATAAPPANHVLYDWLGGQLKGDLPKDKYSKFITSQLRLDASLVVENTNRIARTAVWRAMRKESLAQALHFASRRAAIDSAVLNNQPADRETVAEILRQDPTLSEDLTLRYARHLLAFTLVLDTEIEHADVLPVVSASNKAVAEAVYQQLKSAVDDNSRYAKVLQIVERWLTAVPQATSLPWHRLAFIAIARQLDELLKERDTKKILALLRQIQAMPSAMQLHNILPRMIEQIRAAAAYDTDLTRAIFSLAARHMSLANLQNLATDPAFIQHLPPRVQYALTFLYPEPRENPPEKLFINAVSEVESDSRLIVMSRLIEWAVSLGRTNLVDQKTLEGVMRAAQAGYAEQFDQLIQYFTQYYTSAKALQSLSPATLEILPVLYFTTGRYDAGLYLLQLYQNEMFGKERLEAFTQLVGRIFLNLKLPVDAIQEIFTRFEQSKLRSDPRARAYIAMLIANEWNDAYRNPARRLSAMVNQEKDLVEVVGQENIMRLLEYHAGGRDAMNALEAGQIMLDIALKSGEEGRRQMVKVYELLSWEMQVASAAMALLRAYVRQAENAIAPTLPAFFSKHLGESIGKKLQATYLFRVLMGEGDLQKYVESIEFARDLFYDIVATYQEGKDTPPPHRLRSDLDVMSGGLNDEERGIIGTNLDFISRHIFQLGTQRPQNKKILERNEDLLLNRVVPETGLEMLLYLGGYFGNKQKVVPDYTHAEMRHLFGNRNATMMLRETEAIENFLHRLMQAFAQNSAPKLDIEALNEELENLWRQIKLYNQKQMKPVLAEQTQHIAFFIPLIASHAKKNPFTNKDLDTGKAQPQNELEALRWVSGYFNRTHKR